MIKQRIDDLVDILSDKFAEMENTFIIRNNQQLASYIDDPTKWVQEQRAKKQAYKKELIKDARKQITTIKNQIEKVMLLSYKQIADDTIEISETEIKVHKIPQSLRNSIKAMQKDATDNVIKLANATFQTYNHTVRLMSNISPQTDLFYNSIKHQMTIGTDKGIKINYTDAQGKVVRQMSWKGYMEMKVRTDLHAEMSNQQLEFGERVGQVFYVTDKFQDCAKDHAEYQDMIFYDENVQVDQEVQDYINSHNLMSVQDARANGLTTRPNCRHEFHAIPTDDVIGGKSAGQIQKAEGFTHGTYKAENYDITQEQRYNERMIRKYKLRVENQKQVAQATGNTAFKPSQHDMALIRKWQKAQRELEKAHPTIVDRNYERERIGIIVNDLGVRYDSK